ncbi:MAG: aminotransferase class V-fold PLP-dependent enzyme [Balneola sp.]|nr:MAG: aminotransferase class V-fold PLP-dependent enzyme [Balneola sp.]
MNSQKHLFNLDPNITYLNCAYMSPMMKTVEEAGHKGLLRKRQPNEIGAEDFFNEAEELRQAFAQFVNVTEPNRVAIVASASYGLANVANNLKLTSGDEILLVGEQFPSNVYSWRKVAAESGANIITVPAPPNSLERGTEWNTKILNAISPKTKLVACAHAHWSDGTLFDLKAIRKRTNEVGAWLAIDGTQTIGALPFDIEEIQPDALIASGYKSLMGPYGIGMAYYGPALDGGVPIEENWINRYKSEDFRNLVNYSDDYQPGALRYEVGGHSNFILVPMLLEAIRVLNSWGVEEVQNYCKQLVHEPVRQLRDAGFIIEKEDHRASNIFGIRLGEHHDMADIKNRLQEANVFVSYRGDAVRISPNVYNETADMDLLVKTLTR